MNLKRKIILIGIIILLIILISFYLGGRFSNNFSNKEKTTKFGLENVGELVTQTCYTTVLEDSKVNKDFFNLFEIPFSESRQIFSYDFGVDASIDFQEIKYTFEENKKEIKIKLPEAKVYKTTLNPNSFKVYLDVSSFFSRIDLETHNEAIKKMSEQAVDDCLANNLLDSAKSNAKNLIIGLIKGNKNYNNYNVIFE